MTTLNFCAWCGSLLPCKPDYAGLKCENCDEPVEKERIQGLFEAAEANSLLELFSYEKQ